jgi:hypothetical protein
MKATNLIAAYAVLALSSGGLLTLFLDAQSGDNFVVTSGGL